MAWLEKRPTGRPGESYYRLRDRIKNRARDIFTDLGTGKQYADQIRVEYQNALAAGFKFTPPIADVEELHAFTKAIREGRPAPTAIRRAKIEEICDWYLKHHGPSLKGGVSEVTTSPYCGLRYKMDQLKTAWAGKYWDEINFLIVRDFLATYDNIGTKMRWLGVLSNMFKSIGLWQKTGGILPYVFKIPEGNPAREWRGMMKSHEKKELPDTRVLTRQEWNKFKVRLTARARAICEIALRRFLRKADIKKLSSELVNAEGHLSDIEAKTGNLYVVPVMPNQPKKYDFTNFTQEFKDAKIAAEMNWAPSDPRYFSLRSLRRTGATWAYNKTKDIVTISKMLGHQSIATTERYLSIDSANRGHIADVMDHLADGEDEIREVI